jgi:peptidyl-prolyl cis-trans isomerase B (cyclophilin B)
MITLHTNLGNITIELNFEKAPISAANFLQYCRDDFYNNTIFHRVIDGFMIQGGALTPGMTEKTGRSPIENEADNGLSNDTGTLAMARTSDPHSASSQFFINVADNDFLNHTGKNPEGWGYAVFGKVTDGMDVVERIKGVTTTHMSYRHDVPYETVEIRKVTISDAYSEK